MKDLALFDKGAGMSLLEQDLYKAVITYGHATLRSWFELAPDGETLIGMGQSIWFDEHGNVTKVVTEPTGITMVRS